ncbi:MAG: NHL repeat-containing protein [Gemmatimonadales bacterium]|nr:NHL repeat-containing protein [Gemmatimonadales bacterium]
MPHTSRGVESPITLEFVQEVDLLRGAQAHLYPSAVTYDPVGNEICVTENRGRSFHILNNLGLELFRTGRFADLRGPQDGSLAADGSIIFLDLNRDRPGASIRKLNLFGEPVVFLSESPSPAWSPQHLVITPDGGLLTLDGTLGILAMHDADSGSLLWKQDVMENKTFDLGLGRPGCSIDGRILVPGGESHQVHVFSAEGTPLNSFGKLGTGPGGMVFPVGVAFGPEDMILVLDRMRHKILVFDSAYQYVTELGRPGIWPGQFYHPLAIAASDDGRVFVSQGFQSRVQVFKIHLEALN